MADTLAFVVSFAMGLYLFAVIMNACGACILNTFLQVCFHFGVYICFRDWTLDPQK